MLIPAAGFAQTQATEGRITGRVLDASTAKPLPGVQVQAGDISAFTDLDGRYVIQGVSPGTVAVTARIIGYGAKTVTGVEVVAGEVAVLDITLEESAIQLNAIVIEAERERGSQAFLLDQRRVARALVEGVGVEEIRRRPDSDAAEVASRLAGATVSEGKYVFVRGLGSRYSQTSLNGSSLPSTEPEREVVPLDLFPAGFLESLQAQKSYTPDLPADFSGGAVQIETKDFPNELVVRVGIGTSMNSNSQFKPGFLSYAGGGRDWLGLDDGTRDQPRTVRDIMGPVTSGQRLPSDPAQRVAIGEALQSLNQPFSPRPKDTPLNRDFNLSIGGRTDVFDNGELGYFVAGTYSDKYSLQTDDIERKWRVSAFNPDVPAEVRQPNVDYTFTNGSRNVSWGTIGNITIKPSPDQKISLRTMVNLDTEDEARTYIGDNREDIGGTVKSERLRFIERMMLWGQLSGEHSLFADSRLDWRLMGARAKRDEPLLRESIYVQDDEDFYLHPIGESGRYLWSALVDDEVSLAVDWSLPFAFAGDVGTLKIGAERRERTRDFAARRLNWDFIGGVITDIDAALANATIVDVVRNTGEFAIEEVVEPGDLYDADDDRAAGYAMVDLPLGEQLRAITGARVETYKLGLFSRGNELQSFDQTDIAPSLNLIYTAASNLKFRGAVSRTVDRPEFRELAPFQFTEATSLRQLYGNPNLEPAEIVNADLRVDWFPGLADIVSASVFFKDISDPIEQVFIAAASTAYSFQNAKSAKVYGIELDTQLGLRRLSESLAAFSVHANYARIKSDVEVRSGETYAPTNQNRPLEGQAPYVLNAGLNYAPGTGFEAGLFANRFGDRLTAAGGGGIPDLYEKARTQLDLTLGFPVTGGATAKVKVRNLLDAEYRFEQSANGITQVQRLYSTGRTFSLGLSWDF